MGKHYIPRGDVDFDVWQRDRTPILVENMDKWGIKEESIITLWESKVEWDGVFGIVCNKSNRTQLDVRRKNEARKAFEREIRQFINLFVRYNPKVSDSDRQLIGLSVRAEQAKRTLVPATRPEGMVNYSARLLNVIHFRDSYATGKAKPNGVLGCEVWYGFGGDVPVDGVGMRFLGIATCTPYRLHFEPGDLGKRVHYLLRWVNSRGEHGEWSKPLMGWVAE
jgi:hypothetical protein